MANEADQALNMNFWHPEQPNLSTLILCFLSILTPEPVLLRKMQVQVQSPAYPQKMFAGRTGTKATLASPPY